MINFLIISGIGIIVYFCIRYIIEKKECTCCLKCVNIKKDKNTCNHCKKSIYRVKLWQK